jgi:superfamily II DNA or RNA helicase
LRLPPSFQIGLAARRDVGAVRAAARRDCRNAGLRIDTPVSRYGTIKLWKARSVDLRRLMLLAAGAWAGLAPPDARQGPPPGAGTGEGEATLPKPRPGVDDLLRRLAAALQPPPEALLVATGPLEWPGPLFPYQREGILALMQSPHLLLGDDMGLGKTIQAIASLRLLLVRREIERALVVTPASLLEQWRRELARWAPELRVMTVYGPPEDRFWQWQYRAHVTLTSYDTLRADDTGSPSCGPRREPWGVVVLDEAQRIKNRATDIARTCKRLPRYRSWALTGTPLENSPDDVRSILEFVTGIDADSPLRTSGVSLRVTLSQYQLRRRKADVLQYLPPKSLNDLPLPLTRAQRHAYERAEQEGIVRLRERGETRIENVLTLITRLKQICNFAPDGASAKMEDLENRLEELSAAGHKALVFTQYAGGESGARRIARGLQRFSPLIYTGDMTPGERARTIDRFQQDEAHRVLILSLKSGGQGLNLQRASYVFHFDRGWNPAVERQAEDRVHRLGQTQPVHVYRYVMTDTIEERIDRMLKGKTHLFEQLVDETSLDLERLIDQRDLYGLVGLEPPAPAADPSGASLEDRVADLLARQGYQVQRVGGRSDGGVDVIAEKQDAVGTRTRLYVQCKETREPVGVEVVRSLYGVLPPGDRGVTAVVASPAGFTADARSFADARQVQLWDAARLQQLARGSGKTKLDQ